MRTKALAALAKTLFDRQTHVIKGWKYCQYGARDQTINLSINDELSSIKGTKYKSISA